MGGPRRRWCHCSGPRPWAGQWGCWFYGRRTPSFLAKWYVCRFPSVLSFLPELFSIPPSCQHVATSRSPPPLHPPPPSPLPPLPHHPCMVECRLCVSVCCCCHSRIKKEIKNKKKIPRSDRSVVLSLSGLTQHARRDADRCSRSDASLHYQAAARPPRSLRGGLTPYLLLLLFTFHIISISPFFPFDSRD